MSNLSIDRDDLAPARGVVFGFLFAAPFWLGVAVLVRLLP